MISWFERKGDTFKTFKAKPEPQTTTDLDQMFDHNLKIAKVAYNKDSLAMNGTGTKLFPLDWLERDKQQEMSFCFELDKNGRVTEPATSIN